MVKKIEQIDLGLDPRDPWAAVLPERREQLDKDLREIAKRVHRTPPWLPLRR